MRGALGSVVPNPLSGTEGIHKGCALVNRRSDVLAELADLLIDTPSGIRTTVDF